MFHDILLARICANTCEDGSPKDSNSGTLSKAPIVIASCTARAILGPLVDISDAFVINDDGKGWMHHTARNSERAPCRIPITASMYYEALSF